MTMSPDMRGSTVLVTGGTGGIGKATARLAAWAPGRDRRPGRARAEDAAARDPGAGGGQVDVFVADLSSQAEVRRLAAEVSRAYPRLDVLVNNVGGYWATGTSPPTGSSAPSRSTTSPRSC